MRIMDRLLLLAEAMRDRLWWFSDDRHLTTDPACKHYRAPRRGSRLDRASRGVSCGVCMRRAAFASPITGDKLVEFARARDPKPPVSEGAS